MKIFMYAENAHKLMFKKIIYRLQKIVMSKYKFKHMSENGKCDQELMQQRRLSKIMRQKKLM